jgi:hypothetical protein
MPPVSGGAPGPDEDEWRTACALFRTEPAPFEPSPADWPREKTAADRRQDRRDVERFYRLNRDA